MLFIKLSIYFLILAFFIFFFNKETGFESGDDGRGMSVSDVATNSGHSYEYDEVIDCSSSRSDVVLDDEGKDDEDDIDLEEVFKDKEVGLNSPTVVDGSQVLVLLSKSDKLLF